MMYYTLLCTKVRHYIIFDVHLLTSVLVLAGLRRHEDGWVFEEPVTEDIAPGYFDVVSKPMDFVTVEKNIEKGAYTTKDQVTMVIINIIMSYVWFLVF